VVRAAQAAAVAQVVRAPTEQQASLAEPAEPAAQVELAARAETEETLVMAAQSS
jgi:hypothetical protein